MAGRKTKIGHRTEIGSNTGRHRLESSSSSGGCDRLVSGLGLLLLVALGGSRSGGGRGSGGRVVRRDHGRAGDCGGSDGGGRDGRRGAGRVGRARETGAGGADAGFNQVLEPGTGVELAVDGVNQPRVGGAVLVLDDFHADQADDGLGVGDRCGVGGLPADDDGVARVPEVEALEVDGRLLALADLELRETGEGRGEEVEGLCGVALRAGVDQGVDGLGVVGEVGGEHGVGERIAVAFDQGGVGGCDLVGLGVTDTLATAGATLLCWCGDGAESSEREEDNGVDGRHCDCEKKSATVRKLMLLLTAGCNNESFLIASELQRSRQKD
jgi:hypothetical protein